MRSICRRCCWGWSATSIATPRRTQYDDAFRTAVVPVARLLAEHLTRDAISKRLGWDDLEFVFTDVDAPNELEQAQIQQILIGCGVLTVNEVRRMRGLPSLSESVASGALPR